MPPAGRPSKGAGKAPLTHKQIRGIWAELKPAQLHERLRVVSPTGRWALQGSRITGCCPYHPDNSPSFHIYLDRGYAKCYGCDKHEWNPIAFWATVNDLSLSAAFTDLRQQFGLKGLTASTSSTVEAWDRAQQAKRLLTNICHQALVDAVQAPDAPENEYAKPTVEYLLSTRQMPIAAIPALTQLGVMPSRVALTKLLQERRKDESNAPVDALFEKLAAATSGWLGSLVFRLDLTPAPSPVIGRIKLRRPGTRDFFMLSDEYDDEDLGFVGLGWEPYKGMIGNRRAGMCAVHVVEGEFDALSIQARQILEGAPHLVVLSAGGAVEGTAIDHLHAFGVDQVYLMPDAQIKGGDELVKKWLPTINHLHSRVFTAYDLFPGNVDDPDNVVVTCGLSALESVWLKVDDPAIYALPQDWLFSRAVPLLDLADANDVRYKTEIAADLGKLLKNTHDCAAYVALCSAQYDIPSGQLQREIVAKEENEPGYILRIHDVLLTEFFVVGQQVCDGSRFLYVCHRKTHVIYRISLADDASIERELGAALGPAYLFFSEKIGLASFLEIPDSVKAAGKYLQKQDKDLRFYLRQALTLAGHGAPDYATAMHKSQGLHVMRSASGSPTLYLVNGQTVYHGVYDENGNLRWTELAGPSHGDIIFDIGLRHTDPAWLDSVKGVSDLARGYDVNLRSVYDRLHDMLDIGWAFKNHALTVDFLTAHILASVVSGAFRRQVIVAIHADTSSGKTKLLLGLLGRSDAPRIHVLSCAVGMPNFTAAGVRQTMNNKTRPLCLDEFEDEGDNARKSRSVTEILETFRGSTGESNSMTMGSRDGMPQTFTLDFFIYIAAIVRVRRAQDANRMVPIYLEHKEGRVSPTDVILGKYGEEGVDALRRDIDVGLYPRVLDIMTAYDEVEREYSRPGMRPASVESRFFEALYPALSIMKTLGLDYQKFAADYCHGNQESFAVSAASADSSALLSWLVNSPRVPVRVGDERVNYTVTQMLCSPDLRALLNSSGVGVYVDDVTNTLVVNWMAAVQTVLAGHARFGRETNTQNLRELASRSKHAVSEAYLISSGVLARLRGHGLAGVPASHLTGFNVTTLLAEAGYKEGTALASVPGAIPGSARGKGEGETGGNFKP